ERLAGPRMAGDQMGVGTGSRRRQENRGDDDGDDDGEPVHQQATASLLGASMSSNRTVWVFVYWSTSAACAACSPGDVSRCALSKCTTNGSMPFGATSIRWNNGANMSSKRTVWVFVYWSTF